MPLDGAKRLIDAYQLVVDSSVVLVPKGQLVFRLLRSQDRLLVTAKCVIINVIGTYHVPSLEAVVFAIQ